MDRYEPGAEKRDRREKSDRRRDGWRRRRRVLYISLWGVMLLLCAMAWSSRRFSDWYIVHIFPIWVNTYGRAVGMAPFSVGEILIGTGLLLAALGVFLGAAWSAGKAVMHGRKRRGIGQRGGSASGNDAEGTEPTGDSGIWRGLDGFCKVYYGICAWILLALFILMTLNCYILYHGSDFLEVYLGRSGGEYTLEDLEMLRNFVVEQCNLLCCQVPRDEDGAVLYQGNLTETARNAMEELGKTYEGLSGFYPDAKPLWRSDFMSQQYIAGCFFPFSMEANYNDVMYVMNKPAAICHELAHLKGFIREDEANLIGYLACVQSEDIVFRYSGYLSVLYYIDDAYREAAGHERYQAQTETLPQVHRDNIFLSPGERTRIEDAALFDVETVDVLSDKIADARLRLNGVSDGMASYAGVVELLLWYYGALADS